MTMRKFTLGFDHEKGDWSLKADSSGRTIQRFATKTEATRAGVLERVLGSQGGSVKIARKDNVYQEERTYPRGQDPKKSPG